MKINWKLLIICILIPLITGSVSAALTAGGREVFSTVNKPPLSPPAWIFPVVWTLLYTLMGISSYLVYTWDGKVIIKENVKNTGEEKEKNRALSLYGYQLIVNFLWPVFFFDFQWYFFAFLWLVLLWVLVAKMIFQFGNISQTAALLNAPYLLWLGFAGYLNLGIWLLN